jgi:phage terminase small subunit
MPALTNAKREAFVRNIIEGMTQADAYAAAGFAPNDSNCSRLFSKPEVQARIKELQGKIAKKVCITKERVLEELGKLAFANMADYMRVGSDGDPYLDFSALTRDQAAALTEVTVEDFKEGRGEDARDVRKVKFKLADKRGALVDIGKHLGMFTEKVEHSGPNGGPIEVSDADLARLIAFQLTKAAKAE